ncbi:MAG: peptidase S8, partial [Cytophagaceae bacterium]
MVITNNSYGDIISCDYHGTYDLISRTMDQMAIDYPNLSNVFASGNSGGSTCAPFATGYRTVLGGYQSAKNVMTVGATTDSLVISSFSSKGPVRDGRVKPEITAMGQRLMSAGTTNIYYSNQGTSMASP